MSDLQRMKEHYIKRDAEAWSSFNCYPFFLDCTQSYYLTQILAPIDLSVTNYLDIGAGEGNFILKLMALGVLPQNITAVEYLETRFVKLQEKLPYINAIHQDFMTTELPHQYTLITLMAVLTSITDNTLRYALLEKAIDALEEEGSLILYDYFDDKEPMLNKDYRALSLSKVQKIAEHHKVSIHKNVYLKGRYAKGLCKVGLRTFIPLVQSLKIFNDSYHFVVITK